KNTCYVRFVVLFFRLFSAIFVSLFKKRIGPLDTAVAHFRVWPNDLDLNIHMNGGRYVSFMDVARVDLLARMRLLREVTKRGWRPIAAATMIRYRRSLLPFERFTLRSRVVTWDEKWFYFEHIMENSHGELAAMAFVRGLLRGREGNVTPREFIAITPTPDIGPPPMPEAIKRWNETAESLR
ncbi:MAG: thioesterase family protein, partial [Thermoanaerobaculia bacterium]